MGALGSAALNWQTCLGDFKGERGSPVSGAGSGQAAVGNTEGQRAGREPAGGPRSPAERRARPQEAAGAGPGGGAEEEQPWFPLLRALPIVPGRLLRAAFRRRGSPGCSEGRREELPPSGSARPAAPAPRKPPRSSSGGVRQENGYISREESLEVPSTEEAPVRL